MSHRADDPAQHYDRVTEAWTYLLGEDLHYGYFDAPETGLEEATEALTVRLAEAAELEPGLEVLDVGCGTGNPACLLATRYGARVTGISTSEAGLARARERAASRGLADRVRFARRDGMDNGYPDQSFDRVWVMESSHLMPRRDALIAESARVLRPGGRLALCDIILHRDLEQIEVLRQARAFDLLRRVYGRARMQTLDFYAALARDSGLEVVRVEDLSEATRPTFRCWRENAVRWRSQVDALIGAEERARFVESCGVLDGFFASGTLGYGLLAAAKPARGG